MGVKWKRIRGNKLQFRQDEEMETKVLRKEGRKVYVGARVGEGGCLGMNDNIKAGRRLIHVIHSIQKKKKRKKK